MRNGYGFFAMPLGEHLAGIMSGTLAMSAWGQFPRMQHTRIGICGWRTFTSQIRFNSESNSRDGGMDGRGYETTGRAPYGERELERRRLERERQCRDEPERVER